MYILGIIAAAIVGFAAGMIVAMHMLEQETEE